MPRQRKNAVKRPSETQRNRLDIKKFVALAVGCPIDPIKVKKEHLLEAATIYTQSPRSLEGDPVVNWVFLWQIASN